MKFIHPSPGQRGAGAPTVIFNSARIGGNGEELEHYHPEPASPTPGGEGGSRHEATGATRSEGGLTKYLVVGEKNC